MTLYADIPGERLDAFLARCVPDLSRSGAQKLLEEGCVLRGGKPGKKNDKLTVGEEVEVTVPEPKAVDITPRAMELDIVYEDDDVLVINKPKGLVVHPAAGHQDDTLVNGLLYAMGDSLSGINGELRPGIVHGLLAVAKNNLAHTVLASQLKDHTMARTYEAIVCGSMKEDAGTVDAPIGRHPTDRKKMTVTARNSKEAVTHWEVVRRYRGYTHIRCRLETGRTHQIRVHMAHGLRPQEAGAGTGQPVPARGAAVLPPPPGRPSRHCAGGAPPLLPGGFGKIREDDLIGTFFRYFTDGGLRPHPHRP